MQKNRSMLIKEQSLPLRCEICHQADRFNANNNYCARCSNVSLAPVPASTNLQRDEQITIEIVLDEFNFIQAQ